MKTSKNRGARNRRKTVKGGDVPNKKAYIVVSKSKIDPYKKNLLYNILLARPTLNFLDYFSYNMDLVDESLAAIKLKDPIKNNGNPIVEDDDKVYIEEIVIGHNKTEKINKAEANRIKREKREREEEDQEE